MILSGSPELKAEGGMKDTLASPFRHRLHTFPVLPTEQPHSSPAKLSVPLQRCRLSLFQSDEDDTDEKIDKIDCRLERKCRPLFGSLWLETPRAWFLVARRKC